jgi:hypothetical protein
MGKDQQGTWETQRSGPVLGTNARGECITLGRHRLGVGPAHSSGEAGNDRGAKGPERKHAESEGGNSAWTKVRLRKNRPQGWGIVLILDRGLAAGLSRLCGRRTAWQREFA